MIISIAVNRKLISNWIKQLGKYVSSGTQPRVDLASAGFDIEVPNTSWDL